jgi:4-hydroxy-tetrahydrodipicolinate reductase
VTDVSTARGPYRVLVYGPGGLGTVALYETHRLPEFELVGVRAYSAAKDGMDAGELLGLGPWGVRASTDVDVLAGIECDCVLYTARDMGDHNTDGEIVSLLQAGRNVVTPLPYQNAHLFREPGFVERLERACEVGGSTFHATGIDPDIVTGRVALALTGMCTRLDHLTIRETWPANKLDPALLAIVGFGVSPEKADNPLAAGISDSVLRSIARSAERSLGVVYDRVEEIHEYLPTPRDIDIPGFPVRAGTVGRVSHSFVGYVKGEPFFTMQYNWVLGNDLLPPGIEPHERWVVEIEGTPSARLVIDMRGSLAEHRPYYQVGDARTDPGYHGTIAPCLQAIPFVVDAAPGILPSFEPDLHWKSDLRDLVRTAHSKESVR